ncbi:MAG: DoxX family protein, partial [Verrucomicrobia bacterium]|nr:DoxX family protein [Verrucomicrobiota bacterium]
GLELIVGLCLLVGIARREAALTAAVLLLLFLAVSVHAGGVKHPSLGCPCFKIPLPAWANATGWWVAVRNLFFLVLSGLVMLERRQPNSLPTV